MAPDHPDDEIWTCEPKSENMSPRVVLFDMCTLIISLTAVLFIGITISALHDTLLGKMR